MTDDRENTALARDARDAFRLGQLSALLANWLDQIAPLCEPLESPGRRWHPGELVDDLTAHRADIHAELARLKAAVIVEDQDSPP